MPMRVSLLTLGCKVNQAETSLMEGILRGSGFKVVGLDEKPELCIINTCTVTSKSDYQSRQLIRRAYKVGAKVIVTGCYSELNMENVKNMPEVKEVVLNKDKFNYISMLIGNNGSITLNYSGARTRFFLKVQDGCNSCCSYCVIPKARGSSRSVEMDKVIGEVKRAVCFGYKEIVLTGIHLGVYGEDLKPKINLSGLIESILNETTIERLRLSSIEITEIDDNLIRLFLQKDKRLCRHLHIPLQSGDNRILSLMNRDYTIEYYQARLRHISSYLPDSAFGTDIIVGFPGEGNEEFMNTIRVSENLPFSYIHVFPFSLRKGTKACEMPDIITDLEKKNRCTQLRGLSERKKQDYMLGHIGKTLDVLIEKRYADGFSRGTTSNYLKVEVSSVTLKRGSVVPVRVTGAGKGVLLGNPLNCS
ncbi:MAG: tRNA (N(6)-L-threonylcarbamoyladenosine(37)-C(2))-methylthiotransferase MtaB [Nitrospirae bacterium]|nr:tRNA (N(6)-L-threonylcarbamoyladenosine(37)-C(2))-methylthiotransferase MtaB [Nitrospirota bacterium]